MSDFFHPYRVIVGTRSQTAGRVLSSLYQPLGCPILVTDPCTSEMTKYASNAFLATKVSFINQVAALCERAGADVLTVANGMGLDPRIGANFFKPGVGFGGSCLPKDTRALIALARQFEVSSDLFDAVLETNEAQRGAFVEKVRVAVGDLSGKRVAVFGLAFKGRTSDIRESPAVDIAGRLVAEGAVVRAFDPAAEDAAARVVPGLFCCPDPYEAAEGADAIAILTDWPEFSDTRLGTVAGSVADTPWYGRTGLAGRKICESRRDLSTLGPATRRAACNSRRRLGTRVAVPCQPDQVRLVDRGALANTGAN